MRHRLTAALLIGTALVLAACGTRARPPAVSPAPPGAPFAGTLRVATDEGVRSIPLEEYVAGCVVAELGSPKTEARARQRALAVQAILCRSYALAGRGRHAAAGFDLCATTHCQIYRRVPGTDVGRLARQAADETRGLVLTFDGQPVRAVYHAHCGGGISAAEDVWPGPGVPWLAALEEETCAREARWTFAVDIQRLGRALASDKRTALRLPLRDVVIENRDGAGRASTVRVVGGNTVILRGDDFRNALLRAFGVHSLGSTRFSIRRAARTLTFAGNGYGHGVGLCQAGALRLAALGRSPEVILRHYFPGTRLDRVDGIQVSGGGTR